jgi:hypothetical protein
MNKQAIYNPYFCKVKKFRLIIHGLYYLYLSKGNYKNIIGNDAVRVKIASMIENMERGGFYGAVEDYLQIDRIEE